MSNIKSRQEVLAIRAALKNEGRKVVFTNGCFDLIHSGHVDYLVKAKEMGDILILALNTDSSIKRIKGNNRPILKQDERAFICLLYTSDAADERSSVDLGGRRIIKKKKQNSHIAVSSTNNKNT